MANKVAVKDGEKAPKENGKIKKKRSKCCTCCLIFLIVMLVIFGAAFGVGWYFGDKFTKENLGMSLGDTLGVLSDLYWTDDSDVVKNPYKAKDIEGFYAEFKRNVFLKEDAEIDFDSALADAINNYFGINSDGNKSMGPVRAGEGGEQGQTTGSGDDSSILNIFTDLISGVLNRDTIDVERLNEYDENDPSTDEYVFKLKDKQLAAFIGTALKIALKQADNSDFLSSFSDIVDLSRVLSLKQIRYVAKTAKDESGVSTITATSADVTLWFGLQSAAGQAIKHYMKEAGVGWAGGFVAWLGDVILPENVYLTLSVPLYGEAEPKIRINDMNAKEQKRANKLINGILSLTGNNKKLEDILQEYLGTIKPYLEKAASHINFDEAAKGSISIDLLETITSKASEGMSSEPLTKSDLIYVLQVLFSDMSAQKRKLEPHFYQNRYIGADGKEVYIEGGSTELTPIDYSELFKHEIENKYAMDFGDMSLDEVLEMLGMSFDETGSAIDSEGLLGLVNGERFNAALNKDISALELYVTDRMLAAALGGQMSKLLADGDSKFSNLDVVLDALTFLPDENATLTANALEPKYALLAVEVGLADLLGNLGDNSFLNKLVSGLLPESILLTVKVDISNNRTPETRVPTEFVINSCENTDRAIAALEKIVPDLNLNALSQKIEEMLDNMLDQMQKKLNVRLVASTVELDEQDGTLGGIALPDIFTVITDTVLVRKLDSGVKERIVEPNELKDVIRALNDTDGFDSTPIGGDYNAFLAQIVDKYYFAPTQNDDVSTFDGITAFMSAFDTDKFRITGTDKNVLYLAHDRRSVNELKPRMTANELGALLAEQLGKQGNENVAAYKITEVTTTPQSLTLVLAIDISDLLPEKVGFMLNTDYVYATAVAKLSEPDEVNGRYPIEYSVNNMQQGSDTYDNMLDIVRFFNSDFNIDSQIEKFGEILYTELNNLNIGLSDSKSQDGEQSGGNTRFFEFTDDGIELIDFYTFLAQKMELGLDDETTTETVKIALQGMYMQSEIPELYNENNYVPSDILRNESTADAWDDQKLYAFMSGDETYSDIDFNGYVRRVEDMDSAHSFQIVQTTVLNKGNTAPGEGNEADSIRAWINERISQSTEKLTADNEYMIVTVKMPIDKFKDSEKDESTGFMPEGSAIYATLVFKKTVLSGKDHFEQIDLIFNSMGAKEYGILTRLMGLSDDSKDPNAVNIMTISQRSGDALNYFAETGKIDFGDRYGDKGIGSVKYTSSLSSVSG
ncbi:MAG: hypothetical protein J1G01_00630 [Clostridiales bacterium]|nr:hypothetical protein [Clostridiales bacterium]